MPRDFDISPYFEIVKPTIVQGFDYLSLHWADKQKPLAEVAGTFDPFQVAVDAPSLVPETPDPETEISEEVILIERVSITEHYVRFEQVPRDAIDDENELERVA
jgi:hypothetical protein